MDTATVQQRVAERSARLLHVREELKAELFGIDDIIDRVVEAMRAWYVLPEIVGRPVIVCLWGLTGTGKTRLVRLLAQKLDFYDRFVEVQMDGFSHGSGYWTSSISGMLADSGIGEGQRGILLLDEFQRFRTLNDKGADIKVERYQDVWALLSDGQLAPSLSFMRDIEMSLAGAQYERDRLEADDGDVPEARKNVRKFRLGAYEAAELRRTLKLKEPLLEIMAWSPEQVNERLQEFRAHPERWGTDYSRLLIFVAGNLDEMYRSVATRVEDCDTDADIFHQFTRRLSMIDVKKALSERFKPEQIARFGNNHLIYPSLSRLTYERLIASVCADYARQIGEASGLRVEIGADVQAELYANAVFPAQGTRPMFSSVHALLSPVLVDAALWSLETGAQPGDPLQISVAPDRGHLLARSVAGSRAFKAGFELNGLKQRTQADYRALLAVHEAGHALLYGLLLRQVPLEVKINVASFDGGYNSFLPLRAKSRRDVLDMICVGLGGRAAEALVFGLDACTTGAEEDLRQATADAATFVRNHGFGTSLSRTDVPAELDCEVSTAIGQTDDAIEAILRRQFGRAQSLLHANTGLLASIAQLLMRDGEVSRAALGEMLGLKVTQEAAVMAPYAGRLAAFAAAHADREPAGLPGPEERAVEPPLLQI